MFPGPIDDFRIYNRPLTAEEIAEIMEGEPNPFAYGPEPKNGARLEATWANLKWGAGDLAVSHDVYFGTDFDAVNEGVGGTFVGNTALNSQVVGFPSFPAPAGLQLGATYYWRVDEVNPAEPGSPWKGEVWSFTVPPKEAFDPDPADGAKFLGTGLTLSWTPGIGAKLHTVYFGNNPDDVTAATGGASQAPATYDPGTLEPATTYYWRVDEFDGAATHTGNVWSFTTANFLVVDDFEFYTDNDAAGEAIWQAWIDGFEVPSNGSQVGYLLPPYAEQAIVHGGSQSMPFAYDNTAGATNSEAILTLTSPRDWTEQSVDTLSLWFRGYAASVGSFTQGPIGTFTMTGAGTDIAGTSDQFHFAYKTLNGTGSIVARVDSIENTHAAARAGVMIRETLDAGSKHAFVCVMPENGVASRGRTDTNTGSFNTTQAGISAPHWVKLERDVAGNFTASHSTNGTTWDPVELSVPTNISMGSNVYIGLALTSHNATVTCEAKFSNVTITGTAGAQWMNQDIGITSNAPEPLYVAVSNKTGPAAVAVHDDPAAATIDTWTEWVIPLQTFADQGINLADVDKIAIGLGTGAGTAAPGSSGNLFFDDIRLNRPSGL
jgi:hypothetical protein